VMELIEGPMLADRIAAGPRRTRRLAPIYMGDVILFHV